MWLFSGRNRDKVFQGVFSRSENTESHAKVCTMRSVSLPFWLFFQIHVMLQSFDPGSWDFAKLLHAG